MPANPQENVLPIEGSGRVLARYGRSIGSILAEEGKLGVEGIEQVMQLQQTNGLRFGEAALRLGLITEDDLRCAVARQYDLFFSSRRRHTRFDCDWSSDVCSSD